MATVLLDTLRDISAEELGGVVFALTRSVLVTGLESTDGAAVCQEALDAVDLGYGDLAGEDLNLILVKRSIKISDLDKAEVTIEYQHVAETDLQDLANPANGMLVYKVSSGLESTETAVNVFGEPIYSSYTYPDGTATYQDPAGNTLAQSVKRKPGAIVSQGGKVPVRVPTKRAALSGLLRCFDPDEFANGILGKTNEVAFLGGEPGTWLCSGSDYVPWDLNGDGITYRWTFTFEYKNDGEFEPETEAASVTLGWDPQAVFVDDETGKPPPDWKTQGAFATTEVDSITYPVVLVYAEVDFENYLRSGGTA